MNPSNDLLIVLFIVMITCSIYLFVNAAFTVMNAIDKNNGPFYERLKEASGERSESLTVFFMCLIAAMLLVVSII